MIQNERNDSTYYRNVSEDFTPQDSKYRVTKRGMDILISAFALIALIPVFLVISMIIGFTSRGPVIYRHQRVGKKGKPIYILKFRTMVKNADGLITSFDEQQKREWESNYKLENDPRITFIGKYLRKYSLDELPQLVNVLKGDMSLVGPRPVVSEELDKYGANKDKFLSMTPGLTGYWQAYARSDCSYEQRMSMELEYIDHANLLWDIQILLATFGAVIHGKGAR